MTAENPILIQAKAMLPQFASADYISDTLDLGIPAATLTCVLGLDQSGKTRYMRTLAAIEPPASGEVTALDLDSTKLKREEWRSLRIRIGYISQETTLLPTLDGLRNVLFPSFYHRLGKPAEIEEYARWLLDRLRVQRHEGVLPVSMSGVQRSKLILARTLLLEPKVLFLNDPFKLLDALAVVELNDFFLDWRKSKGIAVVMTTDDLEFAEKYADQILFISRGIVCVFKNVGDLSQSSYPEVKRFLSWSGQG